MSRNQSYHDPLSTSTPSSSTALKPSSLPLPPASSRSGVPAPLALPQFRVDRTNPNIIHGAPGSGIHYDLAGAKPLYAGLGPSGFTPGSYPSSTLANGCPNPEYVKKMREIEAEDMKGYILRSPSSWKSGQPPAPMIRSVSPGPLLQSVPLQLSTYPTRPSSPILRPSSPCRPSSPTPMDISRPGTPDRSIQRQSSRTQMPPPPRPSSRGGVSLTMGRGTYPRTPSSPSYPSQQGNLTRLPSLKSTGLLDVGRGKNLPGGSKFTGASSYNFSPPPPNYARPLTPPPGLRRSASGSNRGSSTSLYSTNNSLGRTPNATSSNYGYSSSSTTTSTSSPSQSRTPSNSNRRSYRPGTSPWSSESTHPSPPATSSSSSFARTSTFSPNTNSGYLSSPPASSWREQFDDAESLAPMGWGSKDLMKR